MHGPGARRRPGPQPRPARRARRNRRAPPGAPRPAPGAPGETRISERALAPSRGVAPECADSAPNKTRHRNRRNARSETRVLRRPKRLGLVLALIVPPTPNRATTPNRPSPRIAPSHRIAAPPRRARAAAHPDAHHGSRRPLAPNNPLAGQIHHSDHTLRRDADQQLSGNAVAAPELLGAVGTHVAAGDLGR
jgi:hypothetical protein